MAYIFFDIDGTLWDEKMQIPESTIPTIKQLQKNGHKTFLCSGRSRSNINDKRLLGIGFDGIVATCGNHVEMVTSAAVPAVVGTAMIGTHGFLVGATPSRLRTSSNSGLAMMIPMALEVSMEEPPPIAMR